MNKLPNNKRLIAFAGALALAYSAFLHIGHSFQTYGSFEAFAGSTGKILFGAFAIIATAIPIAGIIGWLFVKLDESYDSTTTPSPKKTYSWYLRDRFLPYLGVILLAWLPTLLVHAPGTITYDTMFQIVMSDGLGPYSAHHPPFDTWLYGVFWSLGDLFGNRKIGLAAHTLFQTLLTAAALSAALCYAKFLNVPKPVRFVLLAITALLPLFPLAAECMTKDYLFAAFFLAWLIMFTETIRTKGKTLSDAKAIVLFVFLILMMALTKKTGVYIAVPSAIFAVILLRGKSIRLVATTLASAFAYVVLIESIAFSALGILPGSSNEMLSIPLQQTARYAQAHPDDITNEEKAAIEAVLPSTETLAELYNPALSDPIKARFNQEASFDELLAYAKTWIAQGIRHPTTYAAATIANTYEFFYPQAVLDQFNDIPSYWQNEMHLEYLKADSYEETTFEQLSSSIEDLQSPLVLESVRTAYGEAFETMSQTPVFGFLFTKAFWASWLPLFALAYAAYRKNWTAIVCLLPILLVLCTLIAGPVSQSRYVTPNLYSLAMIVASFWLKPVPNKKLAD